MSLRKCEEGPVINGLHECAKCGVVWTDADDFPNWEPFTCPERSGWCLDFPFPSDVKKVGKVWQAGDGTVFVSVGKWGMALADIPVVDVEREK